MKEFVATAIIREHSGLSTLEAQERIRRQVSGLLTGNLEVAWVEVRPLEIDFIRGMEKVLDRILVSELRAKGCADLAKAAADRAERIVGGMCPFKKSQGE